MCGIVGATSKRNIVPVLIEGLRRLEYRGYDSAGLAIVNDGLRRLRSTGRVADLAERVDAAAIEGHLGIAHTRWATHGAPSERNAHPHISGDLAVVHNGIIENHDAMRRELKARGFEFVSDTDTEVIAHLIESLRRSGKGLFDATREAVTRLEGITRRAIDRSRPNDRYSSMARAASSGDWLRLRSSESSVGVSEPQSMVTKGCSARGLD